MDWSWLAFIVGLVVGLVVGPIVAAVVFFKDMDLFPV